MQKLILAVAAASALSACGDARSVQDSLANAVDEEALASSVDRSIDEQALQQVVVGTAQGAVRGAVEQAIQDVVPVPSPELRALGAAVDERTLVDGIAAAVDEQALGRAVESSVSGQGSQEPAEQR